MDAKTSLLCNHTEIMCDALYEMKDNSVKDLEEWEKADKPFAFCVVYLDNDHTEEYDCFLINADEAMELMGTDDLKNCDLDELKYQFYKQDHARMNVDDYIECFYERNNIKKSDDLDLD